MAKITKSISIRVHDSYSEDHRIRKTVAELAAELNTDKGFKATGLRLAQGPTSLTMSVKLTREEW